LKLTFFGGVRTVTGSCYLLQGRNYRILIECGMYQGQDAEAVNRRPFSFDPAEIDCLFLTHSHLDHIGLVPRLVKKGSGGRSLLQLQLQILLN